MKRVLALLLACMLPICAMAETYALSLVVEADEALLANAMQTALADLPEAAQDPHLDTYIRLVQQLLDGLGIDVVLQDDAISMAISLDGGSLLDFTVHNRGDRLLMTSSLMAGYALEEACELPTPEEEAAQAMLNELDWEQLGNAIGTSFDAWKSSVEPVATRGQFVGDAYTGGTQCTTWAFTDKDISALLAGVCSGEVRDAAAAALTACGFDASHALDALDHANARVAAENAYQYLLRVVTGEEGELVGCSLAVFSGMAQLATASLGLQENEWRLVIGLGVQDQNYWCEMTATAEKDDGITLLSGQCIEWMADQLQSFACVKAAGEPVSHLAWQCTISELDQKVQWSARLYEGGNPEKVYLSSNGTLAADAGTLDSSLALGESGSAPLTLKVHAGPAEEISAPDDDLVCYSLTDSADAEQVQALMEQMSAKLMARLLKLLPLELVLQLSMPQIP